MSTNIILETKFVADISGSFYIPSYQRGYRWSETEVVRLLDDMDKKGQYIPFCTKMVFLKYYTPSAENQLHFWGQADRIAYIKAINDVLSDYIEPIVLEKEETK